MRVRQLLVASIELHEAMLWYRERSPRAADEIVILAYAHHSRRPGYWRDRLPATTG